MQVQFEKNEELILCDISTSEFFIEFFLDVALVIELSSVVVADELFFFTGFFFLAGRISLSDLGGSTGNSNLLIIKVGSRDRVLN